MLRKEIISIHRDDAAIVREGIHALTQPEIDEVIISKYLSFNFWKKWDFFGHNFKVFCNVKFYQQNIQIKSIACSW